MPKKVLSIFGTRPEAIKMAPIIKELENDPYFESKIVVTGQHRAMLDQVLAYFEIMPDYDLNIMTPNQTLSDITVNTMNRLDPILKSEMPDVVLVHGDTTTTLAGALSAYYQKIPLAHIESGLRTGKKFSPFPEEMNRQLVDALSDFCFAPTLASATNLTKENHPKEQIFITGNTAIDTLKYTITEDYHHPSLSNNHEKKKILVTMHRRENLGEPMLEVFQAISLLARERSDIEFIFPMHKNPSIRQLAEKELKGIENVCLIEPLDIFDFHNFAKRCHLILTDSGGVQEEAPSLGIPVLVLRDTTERPEGVEAGTLKLIGTKKQKVYQEVTALLDDTVTYKKMAQATNPYGDGYASVRILNILKQKL